VVLGGDVPGVQIRLQSPDGDLLPEPLVPVGPGPERLAVADFNRDGNDDLAVTNPNKHTVTVRLGVGNGTFVEANTIDVGLDYTPTNIAVGDLDGDGRDDLAIPATFKLGSSLIRISLGVGDGTFTSQPAIGAARLGGIVAADLRSDADPDTLDDLLVTAGASAAAGSLLGTGGGGFALGAEFPIGGTAGGPRSLAIADFDADGRSDMVAATAADSATVRLGRGDGTFGPLTPVPLAGGAMPRAVAVGDFDSDGHEDFAVTDDAGGGTVRVRLGDGAGGFRSASDVRVSEGPADIAVGDFDDDGNEDIATANTASNRVSVRLGTGAAPLAGNLLVNGGFEGPTPSGKVRPIGITGWELGGGATWLRYGAPSHSFTPSALASPRFATGGTRMLSGGFSTPTDGVTTATQTADVSSSATAIDHGWAVAALSAYLGGNLAYTDAMSARADFLDAGGAVLGQIVLGPVTPADRHNVTTLLRRQGSDTVPAGTRGIRVTLTSIDADKTCSGAVADSVKLTLRVTPPPTGEPDPGTTPPPPPPPPAKAFGARTRVTVAPLRTRIGARDAVRVRIRNGNDFVVRARLRATGTVRAGGRVEPAPLRSRRLRLLPLARRDVALVLPAALRADLRRRHRVRLVVAADLRDPAANSRRVTKHITVRLEDSR